ncbi:hypothetical protein [Janthinobacterium sp. RB2R34]
MTIKEQQSQDQGMPIVSKLLVGVFLAVILIGMVSWLMGGVFPPFSGS